MVRTKEIPPLSELWPTPDSSASERVTGTEAASLLSADMVSEVSMPRPLSEGSSCCPSRGAASLLLSTSFSASMAKSGKAERVCHGGKKPQSSVAPYWDVALDTDPQ